MGIDIHPLRPDEVTAAGEATAAAYREFVPPDDPGGWEDYLVRVADVGARAERALVVVAEEDGKILGTVTVELEDRIVGGHPREPLAPGEAHVRMLGVTPDARRRGVARMLMDACIDAARRAGKRRITLGTTERMDGARRLYEAMGFRRGPDQVFDDGFRLLTYELAL
ncbi:MAG TPA: GNAT family N-acetyltransferase [Actinomycetota bacterium]|nr:GNAT family N-acetyltransferase [Actinomycetota bacterium]